MFQPQSELGKLVASSTTLNDLEKTYILRLLEVDSISTISEESEKLIWKNIMDVKEYFDVAGDEESAIADLKFYIIGRLNSESLKQTASIIQPSREKSFKSERSATESNLLVRVQLNFG